MGILKRFLHLSYVNMPLVCVFCVECFDHLTDRFLRKKGIRSSQFKRFFLLNEQALWSEPIALHYCLHLVPDVFLNPLSFAFYHIGQGPELNPIRLLFSPPEAVEFVFTFAKGLLTGKKHHHFPKTRGRVGFSGTYFWQNIFSCTKDLVSTCLYVKDSSV